VLEAGAWGLVAASSLLVGAAIGLRGPIPSRAIGLVLGFGAGTLISALAFELTEEAFEIGGADSVAIGLSLGALAYFTGDLLVERRGGGKRMSSTARPTDGGGSALQLGAILDGIPESMVLGIGLIGGGSVSVAFLLAVFISNLPEGLSSASGMRDAGVPTRKVLRGWLLVVIASAVAAMIGYGALSDASGNAVGLVQAFAGGAVLTMLVDTMIPEAFDKGGRAVGLVTVLGFALAYLLSTLE
jgi:zinc transporter, ZIP family